MIQSTNCDFPKDLSPYSGVGSSEPDFASILKNETVRRQYLNFAEKNSDLIKGYDLLQRMDLTAWKFERLGAERCEKYPLLDKIYTALYKAFQWVAQLFDEAGNDVLSRGFHYFSAGIMNFAQMKEYLRKNNVLIDSPEGFQEALSLLWEHDPLSLFNDPQAFKEAIPLLMQLEPNQIADFLFGAPSSFFNDPQAFKEAIPLLMKLKPNQIADFLLRAPPSLFNDSQAFNEAVPLLLKLEPNQIAHFLFRAPPSLFNEPEVLKAAIPLLEKLGFSKEKSENGNFDHSAFKLAMAWLSNTGTPHRIEWGERQGYIYLPFQNEMLKMVFYPANYSVQDQIAYVKDLAVQLPKQGKKLCVFIGRGADEPLPKVDNEVWVSLDINLFGFFGKHGKPEDANLSGRVHLKIDMNNDRELLSQIEGLFNKVVLDRSVLKFLSNNPFLRMGSLLKPDGESTLISEAKGGFPVFERQGHSKPKDNSPNVWVPNIVYEGQSEYITHINQSAIAHWERLKNYLSSEFSQVELVIDQRYPYQTNYDNRESPYVEGYFILKTKNQIHFEDDPEYILRRERNKAPKTTEN